MKVSEISQRAATLALVAACNPLLSSGLKGHGWFLASLTAAFLTGCQPPPKHASITMDKSEVATAPSQDKRSASREINPSRDPYDAAVLEAIRKRWYDLLDAMGYEKGRTSGKVLIAFHLHEDGQVSDFAFVHVSVSEKLALICHSAVVNLAPFPPWPNGMRQKVGKDYRLITFTFNYD